MTMGKTSTLSKIIMDALPVYEDERGKIEQIVESVDFTSVLRIDSKAGTIRANHWHKEDYHVCILTKGKMNYYERPVGSSEKPVCLKLTAGTVFYTAPMVEHAMEFTEDAEFWCFSKLSREQDHYENDTTRMDFDLTKI